MLLLQPYGIIKTGHRDYSPKSGYPSRLPCLKFGNIFGGIKMISCQLCQKNQARYRCSKCGRSICWDCLIGGVCSSCYNAYPAPPQLQPASPGAITSCDKTVAAARRRGILVGILLGLFGSVFGLISYCTAEAGDEKARAFGRNAMAWGFATSAVIYLILSTWP